MSELNRKVCFKGEPSISHLNKSVLSYSPVPGADTKAQCANTKEVR